MGVACGFILGKYTLIIAMYNVILPTYNEAESIYPLIRMLEEVFARLNTPFRIIVVDDNSTDGTQEVVKNMKVENVVLVGRPGKLGLGSAYMAGIKHCEYPYTVIMDSDLQHDPFAILEMCKKCDKETDIVTGTRYNREGTVCGSSFFRRLTSCCANNLARYVLGIRTTDLTGSFRLYRTECLKMLLEDTSINGFGFQMEVIVRAEMKGCKIVEQPIVFYDRVGGKSKLGTREFVLFAWAVLRLYLTL